VHLVSRRLSLSRRRRQVNFGTPAAEATTGMAITGGAGTTPPPSCAQAHTGYVVQRACVRDASVDVWRLPVAPAGEHRREVPRQLIHECQRNATDPSSRFTAGRGFDILIVCTLTSGGGDRTRRRGCEPRLRAEVSDPRKTRNPYNCQQRSGTRGLIVATSAWLSPIKSGPGVMRSAEACAFARLAHGGNRTEPAATEPAPGRRRG